MHWTHLNLAKQSKWLVWLNLTEILLVSSSSNDLSSYRWVLGDAWLFSALEILRCFQCPQNKGFLCFHGGRLNKESKAERALLGHLSVHSGGTATQHFTFSHSVQTAGYSKLEPSLGKRNLMVIMNYRRVKVAVHCQGLRWCPVGSQTCFLLICLEALQKRRHDSAFYSRILLGW